MNKQSRIVLYSILLCALFATRAFSQNETFSSPSVEYSFTLPSDKWKITVRPSDANPNVEYVYGDRLDGHLEVRKISVRRESLTADAIRDEEQKRQFLPGYVAGREENFVGNYRGMAFNDEFVRSGRPMSGRLYFLRVNESIIYVLKFSGLKDNLKSIQNQTDSIARTFSIRKP
jgi:hypothetical protein